jgi:cation:H+ antiporter
MQSALAGNSDIGLGNIVGSNIFNVLFILGASAIIAPLVVHSRLVRLDVPLMIAVSVLVLVFGWDGRIGRLDGLIFAIGLVTYTVWCIRQSRRETREVEEEFAHEFGEAQAGTKSTLAQVALIIAGLILLGFGANWLIDGSVKIATHLGVSQLIIGLTIVAVGTSLPEVVTSLVAAWRGERDIAVGNVVGSNLFNILCVLGLSSLAAKDGIAVSAAALRFDIPVMIAVAIACLPIFYTGHVINRWEGILFFFYYIAYTAHLVIEAMELSVAEPFSEAMLGYVIPLTVITLVMSAYRGYREHARLKAAT